MTCVSNHASVELIKFADDTTAVGPVESTYRRKYGVLVQKQQP